MPDVPTWTVFEKTIPVKDAIHLLGRIVENPLRPSDYYVPDRDDRIQPVRSANHQDELEIDSSLTAGESRDPAYDRVVTPYKQAAQHQSGVIAASSTKSSDIWIRLGQFFGLQGASISKTDWVIKSDMFKMYQLEQHEKVLRALESNFNSECRAFTDSKKQRKYYLMVSLYTADSPNILRKPSNEEIAKLNLSVPIPDGTPMPSTTTVGAGAGWTKSDGAIMAAFYEGECAFAAQYRVLTPTSPAWAFVGKKELFVMGESLQVRKGQTAFGDSSESDEMGDEDEG